MSSLRRPACDVYSPSRPSCFFQHS
jgi:hypothetical protein